MSLIEQAALSACHDVARLAGKDAGLGAYRALLRWAKADAVRAEAILRAFGLLERPAAAILEDLASEWARLPKGKQHSGGVTRAIISHLKAERAAVASRIARAEVEREESALALYVVALAERPTDPASHLQWLERARSAATSPDDSSVATSASVQLALYRLQSNDARAADAVAGFVGTLPRGRDALIVAAARLRSRSRFVRASGLGILSELSRTHPASIRRAAMLLGFQHADCFGTRLSAIEFSRLRELATEIPSMATRDAVMHRLSVGQALACPDPRTQAAETESSLLGPALADARTALRGRVAHAPADADTHTVAVAAVATFRLGHGHSMAGHLAQLRRMQRWSSAVWLVVDVALRDRSMRTLALELLERLLSATESCPRPPQGYRYIGRLCASLGVHSLAVACLDRADACDEPRDDAVRGYCLLEQARASLGAGNRARALALLCEARTVLSPVDSQHGGQSSGRA